ncbi:MAG: SRPBCC family protein [Actinomycetota bacterium]|nr:SRPBCC family protein [Actinomycetota bacterium]
MTAKRGSIRREVRIAATPEAVWELAGAAERLPEWFPGIVSCSLQGDMRIATTGSGLSVPERILTCDRLQRRFQYRITTPLFAEHTSTIDVVDLHDGSCLAVYSVDAEPSAMALVIGGAAANALENLRRMLEGAS